MASSFVKFRPSLQIRPTRQCGVTEELLWTERRVRAELRSGDNGPRAVSLAQISLQLSQLRRDHYGICEQCGEGPWIG